MDKFEDLVPEERTLRFVMLNVQPSVFLSMDLDAGTPASGCSRQWRCGGTPNHEREAQLSELAERQ